MIGPMHGDDKIQLYKVSFIGIIAVFGIDKPK